MHYTIYDFWDFFKKFVRIYHRLNMPFFMLYRSIEIHLLKKHENLTRKKDRSINTYYEGLKPIIFLYNQKNCFYTLCEQYHQKI